MNKKILIIVGVLVVLITSSVAGLAWASSVFSKKDVPSDYKIGVSYDDAMKSEKPSLVLFYVDWCRYCMKFMPRFQIVNQLYKDKFNIVMLNVEQGNNRQLAEKVSLTGYPTLYIIDAKYDNRVLLNNSIYMDLGKLRTELDRYLRIRAILDKSSK